MAKSIDDFIVDLVAWNKGNGRNRPKVFWQDYPSPIPFSTPEVAAAVVRQGLAAEFVDRENLSGSGPFLIESKEAHDLDKYEVFNLDHGVREFREGYQDLNAAVREKIDRYIDDLRWFR